jgi:hypothetical protein
MIDGTGICRPETMPNKDGGTTPPTDSGTTTEDAGGSIPDAAPE